MPDVAILFNSVTEPVQVQIKRDCHKPHYSLFFLLTLRIYKKITLAMPSKTISYAIILIVDFIINK
jgi:hypothetical protein